MNELTSFEIEVKDGVQTVSENNTVKMNFRKILKNCKNFEDLYINVNKLKFNITKEQFKILIDELRDSFYYLVFGCENITYLRDSLQFEYFFLEGERNYVEKEKQDFIISNFSKIFPQFTFSQKEKVVNGVGRIDIFAYCGERPVIMELKVKRANPNSQLLAYAQKFKNPILIGITEHILPKNKQLENIIYYTFSELEEKLK